MLANPVWLGCRNAEKLNTRLRFPIGRYASIASTLAKMLDADVEEILDKHDRVGPVGYLRSLVEAINQRPADVAPASKDVSSYELVVIGTPVWAGSLVSPVRAYPC